MPGLPDTTSSAPSDRGDTSAAPNGRAKDGVPEAGGDAEIAAVAIVVRHVLLIPIDVAHDNEMMSPAVTE